MARVSRAKFSDNEGVASLSFAQPGRAGPQTRQPTAIGSPLRSSERTSNWKVLAGMECFGTVPNGIKRSKDVATDQVDPQRVPSKSGAEICFEPFLSSRPRHETQLIPFREKGSKQARVFCLLRGEPVRMKLRRIPNTIHTR